VRGAESAVGKVELAHTSELGRTQVPTRLYQRHHDPQEAKPRQRLVDPLSDRELLLELLEYRMPYGKYQGVRLLELPEAYLAWFARKGMPEGKLGRLMETALVVRSNGLEPVCRKLRAEVGSRR
jgi:uncharacterized protein